MHRPDLHTAQHHWIVHWMAIVYQFCWLWESLRQHPQRLSMAHSESLWDSRVHRPDRQELLPQLHLQRGKQQLNFQVKTGGRQGCVMSAVLFNLVIDRVMQHTTETSQKGSDGHSLIHWRTLTSLMTLHCYFTRIDTYKRRHAVSASLVKR